MIDRKWIFGVGASSALALSALATPFTAAAQEQQENGTNGENDNQIIQENGAAPISEAEAIDTALAHVPGADVADVKLLFDYDLGFGAPLFNIGFGGAGDAGLVSGDLNSNTENSLNLNLIYNIELTNNVDVSVDASTGDVTIIDVSDADEVVEDDDDAIVDDDDDEAVEDDDDAIVDDDDEDAVEDEENGNGEDLAAAVADTEGPVAQAAAYGYRALQVCGDGGFAEHGFDNQGQCVSTAVALMQDDEAPVEEEEPADDNGENGVNDEDEDPVDDNGENGVNDEDEEPVDDNGENGVNDEDEEPVDENGNNGNGNGAENGNGNGNGNNGNGANNGNGNGNGNNGNGNG